MIERCGDRQRKFDGLEKWPFRLCMESLPIMLQIALLLLMCGLSGYTWQFSMTVGCIIITSTVLGVLFYLVVVVAGTSSYECPFQTPASIALRHLRDSETAQKLSTSLSPPNIISLIRTTLKRTRQALRRVYDTTRRPSSWEISPSRIGTGIHSTATEVGHQTIILLLRIDRAFRNAKLKLAQGIRRFRRRHLLPATVEDAHGQPLGTRNGPGLLVRVRELEVLRKQNTHNARCVSWILRNITDHEAIDSAIRLAGTIRWFDGDSDHGPPFEFIVSVFEACLDSNKQPHPGMRDRAYFSAQAILQINTGARARSHARASASPIPAVSLGTPQHSSPDLHRLIRMLERNSDHGKRTLDIPKSTNIYAHSLWMSTLFLDLTRADPSQILTSYESYLSVAAADHKATIANILLMWYVFLGGHVEEETFWVVDKSYVVVSPSFLSLNPPKIVSASDSLDTILSHLSTRVKDIIASGNDLQRLDPLLEFLVAWGKRPAWLTSMAYEWCSVISEAAGRPRLGELPVDLPLEPQSQPKPRDRCQPQDLAHSRVLSEIADGEFSHVGPDRDSVRMDDTPDDTRRYPRHPIPFSYGTLLSTILKIGFRLVGPGDDWSTLHLRHTHHHKRVFETAFSSDDDEVIADAASIWIVGGDQAPPGSFARYFAKRVERSTPFSRRPRQISIRVIERTLHGQLETAGLETVRLLNRLDVDVDDMVRQDVWAQLLVDVVRVPAGLENMSSHYWRLLGELSLAASLVTPGSRDVEVMRSLETAEDWEKLEVWVVVVWSSLSQSPPTSTMEDIERATLDLLLRRPSVSPRFEALCERGSLYPSHRDKLWQVCKQAQKEQLPLESSPSLYVSVRPVQHLSVLISPFSLLQSISPCPATYFFPFVGKRPPERP
jgi:hypothetical protein